MLVKALLSTFSQQMQRREVGGALEVYGVIAPTLKSSCSGRGADVWFQ